MIFVTVGTHEQPFDRLVKCIDDMKRQNIIEDEVVIQTGYSLYEPANCKWKKMFSYEEMIAHVRDARIVITHGGPSSFFMPLQIGKIPVVVPRRLKYHEHVNDHQAQFCHEVCMRKGNIIVVDDVQDLEKVLKEYDNIVCKMNHQMTSNNVRFNENLEKMLLKIL